MLTNTSFMEILTHPAFIGGVLPMIFFALMDFSYRVYAGKTPFQNVFFFTALGGVLTMTVFTLFTTAISIKGASDISNISSVFLSSFTWKAVFVGIFLGIIWSIAIASMGFAYEKLKTNAAQVVPIASSSGLLTAFLGVFVLQETTSIQTLAIASSCIIIGVFLLSRAEKNIPHFSSSWLGIFLGGIVPFISFGVLNLLFKYWSELNPGVIGICMAATGVAIALFIQILRKSTFSIKVSLLLPGMFWALAVGSLGYGFWPLGGQASILLPIVGCSPLISLALIALFLDEKVDWKKIGTGALLVIAGIGYLNYAW